MMKTLPLLAILFTLAVTTPAWAVHEGHAHDDDHSDHSSNSSIASARNAACEDTIQIKANGLICDFCARALEKMFGQRDDVAGIDVDLDKGTVTVAMKPGQTLDDETLKQLITDSGYNVTDIKRGC